LRFCIAEHYFTLNELNDWIENFDFGPQETSNKISKITRNHINSPSNELPGQNGIFYFPILLLFFLFYFSSFSNFFLKKNNKKASQTKTK